MKSPFMTLEAKTDDRTDFYVAFYGIEAPLVGFCVRSRLGDYVPVVGWRACRQFEVRADRC